MAGVDIDKWCTRPRWTVHEGAMLLIGEEPTGENPPSMHDRSKLLRYSRIVAAAVQDLDSPTATSKLRTGKLRTDWMTRHYPIIPCGPGSAEDTEVSPLDFFRWALCRRFPMSNELQAAMRKVAQARSTGESRTKNATQARAAARQTRRNALREFIDQSVKRATELNRHWALKWKVRKELPCTRQQFMDVFFPQYLNLKKMKPSTIRADLKSLGIRLKKGSRQSAHNPLSELSPKKRSR